MPLLCRSCGSQVVYLRTQRTAWFDSGYIAVRHFTEYFIFYVYWGGYGSSGRFSTCSFSVFAWFNSEYKFLRQSTWLVFLVTTHLALFSFVVLRPLKLDIMAGMDQKDSFMRGFLVALRCRVVVKVSLLMVLTIMLGAP